MKRIVLTLLVLASLNSPAQENRNTKEHKRPVTAIVLGKPVTDRGRSTREPHTTVLGMLLQKYAKDANITVTEAEIKEFVSFSRKMAQRQLAEREADRAKLLKDLQSKALDEKERKNKISRLETVERLLKSEREDANMSEEMADTVYRTVAQQMILPWKIKKTLYKQYGGRVIAQKFGAEPLDAYHKFLKEQEKRGAFRFVDDAFAAHFWGYFTNDTHHIFLSKEEGDKFMNTPLWLLEHAEEIGRASSDTDQRNISHRRSANLRQSINPFDPDQKINYIRIRLEKTTSAIAYTINDRPMTVDALDATLGKIAKAYRDETLVVELGPDATPDDLTTLIALLKKHQLKNAARRGEGNQAIWIME